MASNMTRGRKRIVISIVSILSILGAGIAFAYWTSSGTGDGAATTGTSSAFTILADPPEGTIAPGNAGQTVDFHVTNPSANAQYLTSVTVTMADAAGVPWVPPAGCLIDDYTVTMTTPAPVGDIAPGATVDGMVTVTLTNTSVNQDACQGATVPLHFAAA